MAKGMTEGQKVRTRVYLDEFKQNNGGCVICQRKATDYYCNPVTNEAGEPQLMVYGSCTGHAMLSNSDELLEGAVTNLIPSVVDEVSKPVLMVVSFTKDGEDLKYAPGSKVDKGHNLKKYTSHD